MQNYFNIIAMASTILAVFLVPIYVMDLKNKQETFLHQGQYEPKYVMYDDYEMLQECELHRLTYDYSLSICIKD